MRPRAPEFEQRGKSGVVEASRWIGPPAVVDDQTEPIFGDERQRFGQEVAVGVKLHQPASLADPGKEPFCVLADDFARGGARRWGWRVGPVPARDVAGES